MNLPLSPYEQEELSRKAQALSKRQYLGHPRVNSEKLSKALEARK